MELSQTPASQVGSRQLILNQRNVLFSFPPRLNIKINVKMFKIRIFCKGNGNMKITNRPFLQYTFYHLIVVSKLCINGTTLQCHIFIIHKCSACLSILSPYLYLHELQFHYLVILDSWESYMNCFQNKLKYL